MHYYIRPFKDDFQPCNLKVVTGSDGTLILSYFKGDSRWDPATKQQVTIYPDHPTKQVTVTANDILTERKTGLPLNNPHQIIACGYSPETDSFVFSDVYKYTHALKTSTGYFTTHWRIKPLLYILVPFADTPMSEWKFIAVTNSFIADTVPVTATLDIDIDKTIGEAGDEYLPGITLTINNGTVSAQLVDPAKRAISKADIEIYFETTAGYLTKARSKTNASGIATTQLVGAEAGKVKAGFKYFSGKTEIII
jgi:hypothetical protein